MNQKPSGKLKKQAENPKNKPKMGKFAENTRANCIIQYIETARVP